MDIYSKALLIAVQAHDGQRRKYVDQPYVCHPIRVAAKAMAALQEDRSNPLNYVRAVGAAALLHDVIEDCGISAAELEAKLDNAEWGKPIVSVVKEVSNPSKAFPELNRAARKEMDRQHLAKASYWASTIKLADLIDNTPSIVEHDPNFAPVYLKEKAALLEVLKYGHKGLLIEARAVINEGMEKYDMLSVVESSAAALA